MASQVWSDCRAFFLFGCTNSLFLALPHEAFLNRKDKIQAIRQQRKYFGCRTFDTSRTCDLHSLSGIFLNEFFWEEKWSAKYEAQESEKPEP